MDLLAALSSMKPRDGDEVPVFVETPAGSRHKYDLDHDLGLMRWSLELPLGVTFPFSFGFVPGTLADDGDPLDICLLLDGTVPAATVVDATLIGVLRAEQDEDGTMVRNDRVVAVATLSRRFANVRSLADLPEGSVEDMARFFVSYNDAIGRTFRCIGRGGREEAYEMLDVAVRQADKGEKS